MTYIVQLLFKSLVVSQKPYIKEALQSPCMEGFVKPIGASYTQTFQSSFYRYTKCFMKDLYRGLCAYRGGFVCK